MNEIMPGTRPAELVPGEPDEVERLTARLAGFAATAADALARLGAVEASWAGEAGLMFREAGGEVPDRLSRAAAAFQSAARALAAYGQVLRESQAEVARAVRMVEQSTPETLNTDQQTAARLIAHARSQLEEAGRVAAARLARAAADAPEADDEAMSAAAGCGVALRAVTEHELTDPDGFVAPMGEWGDGVADVRFTWPHEVGFAGAVAGAEAGETGWRAWASADPDRQLGVVEPAALAAAGAAAVAAAAAGLPARRNRRQRTALGLVGLDEAELRRRREEFGGARHRDGLLAPARTARLRSADAWRTRLASTARPESSVQPWAGLGVDHLPRARATVERAGSVDRDVRGAVLRTGRPAHEGA